MTAEVINIHPSNFQKAIKQNKLKFSRDCKIINNKKYMPLFQGISSFECTSYKMFENIASSLAR